jgi:hypothetical protein
MARKKKIGLYDIGRVPVTEVGNKSGYESNKELSARLRREEQEELAKKQRAIEAADPTRQAERAYVDAMTELAIKTRDRLKKLYRDVPTIEDYIRHDLEALIDDIGLPTQNPPVTMAEFEERLRAFVEGLSGVTFSSDAARKFELYAWVGCRQGTVIDNSTLQAMLERCESLGIGVTLPKAQRPVTPEPTPTVADIEGMDTNTRENRAAVRELVRHLASEEQVPLRDEWIQHLVDKFNFYITQEQWDWCYQWLKRNNKNRLDPRSFEACRRAAVANFVFPDRCLDDVDRANLEIEALPTATMSFSEKQKLARRLARIQ